MRRKLGAIFISLLVRVAFLVLQLAVVAVAAGLVLGPVAVVVWLHYRFPWILNVTIPLLLIARVAECALQVRRQRLDRERCRWRWAHRCHDCGYSLTGNLSGVCPECGCLDVVIP
jgi:hypothetical protein